MLPSPGTILVVIRAQTRSQCPPLRSRSTVPSIKFVVPLAYFTHRVSRHVAHG